MINKELNGENNIVKLSGLVNSELIFSHEFFGEKFYEFQLKVPRLSEYSDILPITVSERLLTDINLKQGAQIELEGQLRSFNKIVEEKSRLMLTVFVKNFSNDIKYNPNEIILKGYICKPPIYRTTPYNREICDLLLAVNRAYNKSDYIPCIAWGRNARFLKEAQVGQKLNIFGRIQSREYNKKISENEFIKKIAYEVSINQVIIDENKEENIEKENTENNNSKLNYTENNNDNINN